MTVLVALLLGAAAPPAARALEKDVGGPALAFALRASPVANLTYQLDCMAYLEHCSRAAYRALWGEKLQWGAEDDKRLEAWRALKLAYQGTIRFEEEGTEMAPGFPLLQDPVVQLEEKVRIAALQARTMDELGANLRLVMRPPDAARAVEILSALWPRFLGWWESAGLATAGPFIDQSAALIEAQGLVEFTLKVARFYQARLPRRAVVPIHVMVRPRTDQGSSNGERLEDQALIEVIEGERAEDRMDVVAHELFHYFHASADLAQAAALARGFVTAAHPASVAAAALVDEALATALGNGLVGRMLTPPEKFARCLARDECLYNDRVVDRAAKALMPVVERYLAEGKTLFSPSFPADFLEAAALVLAEAGPALYLRTVTVAFDPPFQAAKEALTRAAQSGAVWSSSPVEGPRVLRRLDEYPHLSGVVFVAPKDLGRLAPWEPLLGKATLRKVRAEARRWGAFAFGVRRSPKAYLFVFVAPDGPAAERLVGEFLKCPSASEGVCGTLPR